MIYALIPIHWLHVTAEMILFGTSLFPFYCRIAGASRTLDKEAPAISSRLNLVLVWASILGLCTAVIWLALEAGEMGEGVKDILNPSAIMTVLTGTTFGHVWQFHLVLSVITVAAACLPSFDRHRIVVVLVPAALLLVSQAWVGHAVMEQGTARVVHLTTQVIHLIAGSAWIGGLVPVGFVLRRARKNEGHSWTLFAIQALQSFSIVALISVIMILLSGLVNCWFLVGSFKGLVGTTYGRVLVAKLALFLDILVFAAINRFILLPRLDAGANSRRTMYALFWTVTAEQGLGLAVLSVTSILGSLSPAINGLGY